MSNSDYINSDGSINWSNILNAVTNNTNNSKIDIGTLGAIGNANYYSSNNDTWYEDASYTRQAFNNTVLINDLLTNIRKAGYLLGRTLTVTIEFPDGNFMVDGIVANKYWDVPNKLSGVIVNIVGKGMGETFICHNGNNNPNQNIIYFDGQSDKQTTGIAAAYPFGGVSGITFYAVKNTSNILKFNDQIDLGFKLYDVQFAGKRALSGCNAISIVDYLNFDIRKVRFDGITGHCIEITDGSKFTLGYFILKDFTVDNFSGSSFVMKNILNLNLLNISNNYSSHKGSLSFENGRIEINVKDSAAELFRIDQNSVAYDNIGTIVGLNFRNIAVTSVDGDLNLIGTNYGTVNLTAENLAINGMKNILVPDDKNIEYVISKPRRINNIINILDNSKHRDYKTFTKVNYNTTIVGNSSKVDSKTAFDGGKYIAGTQDKNGFIKTKDYINCENIGINHSNPRIDHARISGNSDLYYELNSSLDSLVAKCILLTTTSGSKFIKVIPNVSSYATAYLVLQYNFNLVVGLAIRLIGAGAGGSDLYTYIKDISWDDANKILNLAINEAPSISLNEVPNVFTFIHPEQFYSPLIRFGDSSYVSQWQSNFKDIQSEDVFINRTMKVGNYYMYVYDGTRMIGIGQMGMIKDATAVDCQVNLTPFYV